MGKRNLVEQSSLGSWVKKTKMTCSILHTLFKEIVELSESYGIHPVSMPRVVGRQVH